MNKFIKAFLISLLIPLMAHGAVPFKVDSLKSLGSVSIGTTADANSKAALDVVSTTKGFLPPRMTTTQRDAIASPPAGLTVYNTTTNKLNAYSGTAWVEVGSGSGDGGINYITNGKAEDDTTGWATYSDAAGSAPVDGSGGTPASSWTRTTSAPLRGTGSFLWTKSAANRQGEGFSYDFTIDAADKGKTLTILADYEVVSGTYATGDIAWYVYDVTNGGTPIQPSGYQLVGVGTQASLLGVTFQAASNSTSYRLIGHTASTSASAYTLKFDNIAVGPQAKSTGTIIGEWKAYTTTLSWTSGVGSYSAKSRRVGDAEEMMVYVPITGTPTTATFTFTPPTTCVIDTAKLAAGTITNLESLGTATLFDASASTRYLGGVTMGSTTSTLRVITDVATSQVTQAVPFTWANGDFLEVRAIVPCAGRSSSTPASDTIPSNPADARYSTAAAQSISTGTSTIIDFGTKSYDTLACVTTGASWKYTAKVPGRYSVHAAAILAASASWSAGEDILFMLYKNGVHVSYLDYKTAYGTTSVPYLVNGSDEVDLVAGDYIDIRIQQGSGSTIALGNFATGNYVAIKLVSNGFQQIAAADPVAGYYGGSSSTITSGAGSTTIKFTTKVRETHSSTYDTSTGILTIPAPGWYLFKYQIVDGSITPAASDRSLQISLGIDGAGEYGVNSVPTLSTVARGITLGNTFLYYLNAGQTVRVNAESSLGDTFTVLNNTGYSFFQWTRLNGLQ